MIKIILGIDVGKTTGLAWMATNGELLMSCQGDYDKLELQLPFERAYMEKVHAFPKQGVVSMFEFGKVFGYWQGLLKGLGYDVILIAPQKWQSICKEYEGEDIKDKVRRYVSEKYKLKLDKKFQHMADAIVIAEAGLLEYLKEVQ